MWRSSAPATPDARRWTPSARSRPDVVFLDVQMPGLDGFGVLAALPAEGRPLVVFVTAYDRYAVAAFEAQALDYLLKPLDPDRLAAALDRLRAHRHREQRLAHAEKLRALLGAWPTEAPPPPEPVPARLLVRTPGKLVSVAAERVRWVEAVGDYARLHLDDGRTHLLRETLTALAARLGPHRFVRLHRSTLVAVEELREIRALGHGDALAVLHDGTTRRIGRAYRAALEARLGRRA